MLYPEILLDLLIYYEPTCTLSKRLDTNTVLTTSVPHLFFIISMLRPALINRKNEKGLTALLIAATKFKVYVEKIYIFFDILLANPGKDRTGSYLTVSELDVDCQNPQNGFTALHYLGTQLRCSLPPHFAAFANHPFIQLLQRMLNLPERSNSCRRGGPDD